MTETNEKAKGQDERSVGQSEVDGLVSCDLATGDIVSLSAEWEDRGLLSVWKVYDNGKVDVYDSEENLLRYDINDLVKGNN